MPWVHKLIMIELVREKEKMAEKSKILIIGGAGNIGKFVVEASVKAGHPTFALVRETTVSDPLKSNIVQTFKDSGVTVIVCDIYDHEGLVKAIKQVDVVISTVGSTYKLVDQNKIIDAIKEAGNIKRFFPSEFGNDADHVRGVEPVKSFFEGKAKIRRTIEASGIPYTFVVANCTFSFFLSNLAQLGLILPPRDKVTILGDGNVKVVFNSETDIGRYTIKSVDDPRTLNKILYVKPPKNVYTFNELVSLWEDKIDKKLQRIYVSEQQLLNLIQESSFPLNMKLGIGHSTFVKGDQTYFEIQPSFGLEASQLYPDVNYQTVDQFLHLFV